MGKRLLLSITLCLITLPLLALWGCGGSSSSTSPSSDGSASDGSEYTAYVYAPSSSGQALFRGLIDTTSQEGVLLLDSPDQAPAGYEALSDCTVSLPDGTIAKTNAQGQFHFFNIPFTNSEKGIPLIIDPGQSNRPQLARLIIPLIIPRRGAVPEPQGLKLVIKPASLLLSRGSKFLFHAFLVDEQGASYQVPPGKVTWSVNAENDKNIGSINAGGLFRSLDLGKGQVVANLSSQNMSAFGEIKIVSNQQVARICGQITDILHSPIAGVIIFVNGFENGVITDREGNFVIPRVPTDESLTLTFIYRGVVVKTLKDVIVTPGEAKEINVSLDTFRETGTIFSQVDDGQTEGRIILTVEGLPGPLSTDEFQTAKEFELLKVAEVDPNLYLRLQNNPELRVHALVEGTPLVASAEVSSPQIEVARIVLLPVQQSALIRTLEGDLCWQQGQTSFKVKALNNAPSPGQFTLEGMDNFPRLLAKLQESAGVWLPGKVIGQLDLTHRRINLLDISLLDLFFQGEGSIYYDPDILSDGAIIMEPPSDSNQTIEEKSYILLNVESIASDIYNLLTASANRKFPGEISGIETNDPNFTQDGYQSVKISRIQIFTDSNNYLLHKLGKIWLDDDDGQIRFSPSLSLEETVYLLEGVEEFDEIMTTLEQSPGTNFSCFLSGEIQDTEAKEIAISHLELVGPVIEPQQTGAKPTGFTYYEIDNELPIGGRYIYKEFNPDGSIGNKVYELSNLTLVDRQTADLLEAQPGLIVQIILNFTETSTLSGQESPINRGTTSLRITNMEVLNDAAPLYQVSGNLIYHSWENVLEMIASSPSFSEGSRQTFILRNVPAKPLKTLLKYPDRFVPVLYGIIQVLPSDQRYVNNSVMADALDLQISQSLR